jgi:hypothetical protein
MEPTRKLTGSSSYLESPVARLGNEERNGPSFRVLVTSSKLAHVPCDLSVIKIIGLFYPPAVKVATSHLRSTSQLNEFRCLCAFFTCGEPNSGAFLLICRLRPPVIEMRLLALIGKPSSGSFLPVRRPVCKMSVRLLADGEPAHFSLVVSFPSI